MKKVKNKEPRRIKILGFHESDACFEDKEDKRLIGKTGMFTPEASWHPKYFSGSMVYDEGQASPGQYLCKYFYAVRYKRL